MNDDALRQLPRIALDAVAHTLRTGRRVVPDVATLPHELAKQGASFVTLEREGNLLGCIGALEPTQALGVDVARHGLGAAFDDPRLPPCTVDDYVAMQCKVSVLSPLEPREVASREDLASILRPGVDGLVIEAGRNRATFLPSVWRMVADTNQFLEALWDKANLPRDAWPLELRVATYTTTDVSDPGPRAAP